MTRWCRTAKSSTHSGRHLRQFPARPVAGSLPSQAHTFKRVSRMQPTAITSASRNRQCWSCAARQQDFNPNLDAVWLARERRRVGERSSLAIWLNGNRDSQTAGSVDLAERCRAGVSVSSGPADGARHAVIDAAKFSGDWSFCDHAREPSDANRWKPTRRRTGLDAATRGPALRREHGHSNSGQDQKLRSPRCTGRSASPFHSLRELYLRHGIFILRQNLGPRRANPRGFAAPATPCRTAKCALRSAAADQATPTSRYGCRGSGGERIEASPWPR